MKSESILNKAKVRELREALGLSQEAAASAAGLSGRSGWSNIENGDQAITLTTLARIAKVLGCDPAELLFSGGAASRKRSKAKARAS